MRCELKHAVKDECTTLKEAVAPVPTIVLNHVMCFRLDPKVKCDENDAANPTTTR